MHQFWALETACSPLVSVRLKNRLTLVPKLIKKHEVFFFIGMFHVSIKQIHFHKTNLHSFMFNGNVAIDVLDGDSRSLKMNIKTRLLVPT